MQIMFFCTRHPKRLGYYGGVSTSRRNNETDTMNATQIDNTKAIAFAALPIGAQFTSLTGGVICTKIAKGKSAFANKHNGKVFVCRENWNTKVVPL